MSTCLIITQGNKMYIGADSACSVKTPEGFRRYSDDMQKLFQLNEQVFFCSGNMNKVYECVDWIYDKFTHSICIEDLKNYLINNCNERLDEYYNIEILIVDYKTNVVYQLSQYNNFEILTYPYSEQLRIICGGYKTKDTFTIAKKNILLKQSIHNIYHNTYQTIADECVGGYLYLYSSPTDFHKVKIIEDNIKYVCTDNELHLLTSEFVTSGFINGSQIIGGDIYSSNYSSTTGTHFGLNDETVQIGGDALTYNTTDGLSIIGKITATTIETSNGTIGKFTLGDALYSGTNSLTSTTPGVYIGTDGIRQYNNANQYVHIQDGILKCNGAQFTGSITGSSFIVNGSVTKYAKDYSENDITIMREIIVGIRELTPAYLEKYDLNGDGIISTLDVVKVQRLIDGTDTSQTYNTSLNITPTSTLNILTTEGVSIGRLGIYANNLSSITTHSGKYYVMDYETGMGYFEGADGTFKDADGRVITVNGGIIIGIGGIVG